VCAGLGTNDETANDRPELLDGRCIGQRPVPPPICISAPAGVDCEADRTVRSRFTWLETTAQKAGAES
jgi:hypothetical protein